MSSFEAAIIGISNLLGFAIAAWALRDPLKETKTATESLAVTVAALGKEVNELELTIRSVQAYTADQRQQWRERHGKL